MYPMFFRFFGTPPWEMEQIRSKFREIENERIRLDRKPLPPDLKATNGVLPFVDFYPDIEESYESWYLSEDQEAWPSEPEPSDPIWKGKGIYDKKDLSEKDELEGDDSKMILGDEKKEEWKSVYWEFFNSISPSDAEKAAIYSSKQKNYPQLFQQKIKRQTKLRRLEIDFALEFDNGYRRMNVPPKYLRFYDRVKEEKIKRIPDRYARAWRYLKHQSEKLRLEPQRFRTYFQHKEAMERYQEAKNRGEKVEPPAPIDFYEPKLARVYYFWDKPGKKWTV